MSETVKFKTAKVDRLAVLLVLFIVAVCGGVEDAYASNGDELDEFAGYFSSGKENKVSCAPDAGVPGFIGPSGRGVCPAGVNDEEPTGDETSNYVNPVFKGWASGYVDYIPAPAADVEYIGAEMNYPRRGVPSAWRTPELALGPVTGDNFDIVAIGDLYSDQIALLYTAENLAKDRTDPNKIQPGQLTFSFDGAVVDGPGPDFVVFENSLVDSDGAVAGQIFAELAYVEVSSDGENFARFPSVSITGQEYPEIQESGVGPYGAIDPSTVYNLAGKHVNCYESCWGTPFNLKDIEGHPMVASGQVVLSNINYVRLVDVPGDGSFADDAMSVIDPNSIDDETGEGGQSFASSHPIYDTWVTWGSGGADIEAVGVVDGIYGDANSDGRVDLFDFMRLASRWHKKGSWASGDFDENWKVDENDLMLLCQNWLYEVEQQPWNN